MYYNNIGHGGLLQAYSLQKFLEESGYNSEVISYDYNYKYKSQNHKSRKIAWIRGMVRRFRLIPYNLLCLKYGDETNKKYKEYMGMIHHSKYYIRNTISEIDKDYDVIIVGSDQVWNETYCDDAFYLPFIKEAKKKIAYAASVGKDNLSREQLNRLMNKISSFSAISVREKNLQDMLKKHMSMSVAYVCDPTLLHDRFFWSNHSSTRIVNGNYVLLYTLSPHTWIIESTIKFAQGLGLPVVTIPNVNCNMKKQDVTIPNIKVWNIWPQEFLRLVIDAEYIVTDSFHCTVFSLIFNKKFYCFNREMPGTTMNSRLKSLLNYCGIDNHFIDINHLSEYKESNRIDYQVVNNRINKFRKYSSEWLINTLNARQS